MIIRVHMDGIPVVCDLSLPSKQVTVTVTMTMTMIDYDYDYDMTYDYECLKC